MPLGKKRRLQHDRATLDHRLVAHLHIPARGAGIAENGQSVFLDGKVIVQHRAVHKGGLFALMDGAVSGLSDKCLLM